MKYLLDSNIIIAAMSASSSRLRERMAMCDEDDMVTSAIAYAEIAHGAMNGKPPPLDIIDAFLESIPVLPFDQASARIHARLPFVRASYDRLIAAHALACKLTIVTGNVRDFQGIPDLCVEDWTLA